MKQPTNLSIVEGEKRLIPKDRASTVEKYLQSGKEIVNFHPPLFLEEWEFLMECQDVAVKLEERDKLEAATEHRTAGETGIITTDMEEKDGKQEKPKKPKKTSK